MFFKKGRSKMKETSNDYYLTEEEMKKLNKEKEELKKNTKEEDGESKIKLERKVETAIKSLLTEKEDKENKEKAKEEDKEDTEWKKKGFLIALNKKFIFFKKGNALDNVMDAEETKKLIEGLKEVAKASGAGFEEGFTYIKIGKCTIEMVHTDMVEEIIKEPTKLDLPNTPSNPMNGYSQTFMGDNNSSLLPCGFPRSSMMGGCAGCPSIDTIFCPKYNRPYSRTMPPVPPMPGVPNF